MINWHYLENGEKSRPLSLKEIHDLIAEGSIEEKTPVLMEGTNKFLPASSITILQPFFAERLHATSISPRKDPFQDNNEPLAPLLKEEPPEPPSRTRASLSKAILLTLLFLLALALMGSQEARLFSEDPIKSVFVIVIAIAWIFIYSLYHDDPKTRN